MEARCALIWPLYDSSRRASRAQACGISGASNRRPEPALRRRLTALITAFSDAARILSSVPTPHRTVPSEACTSTYAAAREHLEFSCLRRPQDENLKKMLEIATQRATAPRTAITPAHYQR